MFYLEFISRNVSRGEKKMTKKTKIKQTGQTVQSQMEAKALTGAECDHLW
jgi:hypothetical protein